MALVERWIRSLPRVCENVGLGHGLAPWWLTLAAITGELDPLKDATRLAGWRFTLTADSLANQRETPTGQARGLFSRKGKAYG
jgi:hypothetical protein